MDSPHRQARSVARTSARQSRSSPYARPRSQAAPLQPELPRAPSSSFLSLLGKAVSWWVGSGPPNGMNADGVDGLPDEEMPDLDEEEREGTMTPVCPPGGFGRPIPPPPPPAEEEDDDEVQIISPPPPPRPSLIPQASPPAVATRPTAFNHVSQFGPPATPQASTFRPPFTVEDKTPEKINAAIAEFFAKKGGEPLSIIEWNGVQKMLDDLRESSQGVAGEPPKLGLPAYSSPTFHLGAPDRSANLRATQSIAASPRRATPIRGTVPLYIGPGFGGNSRMRSSTKPERRETPKQETPPPVEKSMALTRSTLSASMLGASKNTPATPIKAPESINPTFSRLASKPTAPSPLRNAISQSPGSDTTTPPRRGPTIAASLLKDLMDAGKKDNPMQNPYLSRPGAIKGKVKPKVKPSMEKPLPSPAAPTSTESIKPAVNGAKVPEPQSAKRDAATAALDQPPVAKNVSFADFGAKESVSSSPARPALKKPRSSFADAQEVFELLDDDNEPAAKSSVPEVFNTASASQETAQPATTTPSTSLFGTNGGFGFAKPATTSTLSFGLPASTTPKSASSAPSFTAFGATSSAPSLTDFGAAPGTFGTAEKKPDEPAKSSAFGGSGLFSNGATTSTLGSAAPTFSAFDMTTEPSTTPTKPPPPKATEAAAEKPALSSFTGFSKPPGTSAFGSSAPLSFGGPSSKPAIEPTKETTQAPKPNLFSFGPTSTAFGGASSSTPASGLGSFGLGGATSDSPAPPKSSLAFPSAPTTLAFPSATGSLAFPSTGRSLPSFTSSFASSSTPSSTQPASVFDKPSAAAAVPTTTPSAFGTPSTSTSSDKPITFGIPSVGFKSFGDVSKTPTSTFGSGLSPFAGFGSSAPNLFGAPAGTSTKPSAPPAASSSTDVDMTPASSSNAAGWDKIMAQSGLNKTAIPLTSATPSAKDAAAKTDLPTFAFNVTIPDASTSATTVTSEDKLPSFSFDTKLTPITAASTSTAVFTAAPARKAPAPIIAFDFAAAGLNKPKATGGNWDCPVCMISNKADAAKCAACESDRPGGAPKAAPEPAPAKPAAPPVVNNWAGIWAPPAASTGKVTCKHCGLQTDKGKEKCQVCESKDYE